MPQDIYCRRKEKNSGRHSDKHFLRVTTLFRVPRRASPFFSPAATAVSGLRLRVREAMFYEWDIRWKEDCYSVNLFGGAKGRQEVVERGL